MSNFAEEASTIPSEVSSDLDRQHNASTNNTGPRASNGNLRAVSLGIFLVAVFYSVTVYSPYSALQRYFLGHPIAVAATVLFWFAISVLITKYLWISKQRRQFETLRNEDISPSLSTRSPADRWLKENNAGAVAKHWLADLQRQPISLQSNLLTQRLREILIRQNQRGSANLLADDLRELSLRDSDSAHDSYGLVRIISWAIPMLGFLGTVIGITQTLGGLDFTNGTAAVENLKSGLYVAFDTTAVGLVLSVLAIFIQFPIERSEQRLLAAVDARVGDLVSANLPSAPESDNHIDLVTNLCSGIHAAVAESLDHQAKLWRATITEAQNHWREAQNDHAEQISHAIKNLLGPTVSDHAKLFSTAATSLSQNLEQHAKHVKTSILLANEATEKTRQRSDASLIESLESTLTPVFTEHAKQVNESLIQSTKHLETLQESWNNQAKLNQASSISQEQALRKLDETVSKTHGHSESLLRLQQSLDANLQQLNATNAQVDHDAKRDLNDGLAEAMRYLARTVDQLSRQNTESQDRQRAKRSAA